MGRRGIIFSLLNAFILIIIFSVGVSAADFNHVITNSENWVDVYSGIHYANLNEVDSDFLTSASHGRLIMESISNSKDVLVLTSSDSAYAFNYPDLLKTEGFTSAEEIVSRNLNVELARDLEVENFIVVGDSYGYNAIAVVPYAVQKKSWVFFANTVNIDDIDSVLSSKNINELIIYGYVDREVRDELEKYNPRVINNQDRFLDNIEIVEDYLELNPKKQTLLTNGDFIEKELMSGTQPILFTGKDNVPDQIRDYLKTSEIEIGVLIGNELMGAATNIRRSAGISVMVKFARGARVKTAGVSAVEGLDLFPIPSPTLVLEIYSVEYNRFNNQLEITYKSSSNIPMYLMGSITLNENDGSRTTTGDNEQIFLAPNGYVTASYLIEVNDFQNLKADITTMFGESANSLDRVLSGTWDVEVVDVIDNCEIDIRKIVYNKQKNQFEIDVKNIDSVDCWVDITLENIKIGYEESVLTTDRAYKINPGKSRTVIISEELYDEDLEKNSFINLVARYGQKETSLVKIFEGTFELSIKNLASVTYVIMLLVLGIGIFFFLFAFRRRKEKKEFDF